MAVRPLTNWVGILAGKTAEEAARFILSDLTHYRSGCAYETDDRQQLANALLGFSHAFMTPAQRDAMARAIKEGKPV